jgi:hypothetical protein
LTSVKRYNASERGVKSVHRSMRASHAAGFPGVRDLCKLACEAATGAAGASAMREEDE